MHAVAVSRCMPTYHRRRAFKSTLTVEAHSYRRDDFHVLLCKRTYTNVTCEYLLLLLWAGINRYISHWQSSAVESQRTPGLVFGATSAKEELYFTHVGPRVFGDPSGGHLTDDSIFWICSQTKLITSVCSCHPPSLICA